MTEIILEAQLRERVGKGAARAVRREKRLPAVIYGDKKDPISISLDPKLIEKETNRASFFTRKITIHVGKDSVQVLPRAVQFHPVTDRTIHIDFLRISKETKVHVSIPLHFKNEDKSPGLKRGGILNIVHHEVEVICSASDIPQGFDVDLSGADIGKAFHISAITFPEGVKMVSDEKGYTIATIISPSGADEKEGEAEAGA
jgi:large subunit ribosomal protein L25